MTIESDNLGNGATKPERLGGKFRGNRRDSVLAEVPPVDGIGPSDRAPGLRDQPEYGRSATLPSLDPAGLSEPVFRPADWPSGSGDCLAEHPLLRGLLFELPPRGRGPSADWLDRWFEAARSILELLYSDTASRPR
ncbi:MAG TPA: hypothetical protein VGD43_20415 [Micromonospora sp.]